MLGKIILVVIIMAVIFGGGLAFFGTEEQREYFTDTPLKECGRDCKQLGFEYWRYDSGGFSSRECWCLEEGKPIQIW